MRRRLSSELGNALSGQVVLCCSCEDPAPVWVLPRMWPLNWATSTPLLVQSFREVLCEIVHAFTISFPKVAPLHLFIG